MDSVALVRVSFRFLGEKLQLLLSHSLTADGVFDYINVLCRFPGVPLDGVSSV
jgi:hypothetical protein